MASTDTSQGPASIISLIPHAACELEADCLLFFCLRCFASACDRIKLGEPVSAAVIQPTVCPGFLISGKEKGPCVRSVSLLNICLGRAVIASKSIRIGWNKLKQEQKPHSPYASVLYTIPQNSRCFTRHNTGSSSPNPNPGGKAGCRKEQYDANILSSGHNKSQVLLEDCVCISSVREGFKRGTMAWRTRIKSFLWEY